MKNWKNVVLKSERSLNQMSLNRHSLQCKPYGNQTKVQKCVLKSEMSLNQTSLNRTLPVLHIKIAYGIA